MTFSIDKKQDSAPGAALEPCQDMQEVQEIWCAMEAQQPAWDFNATWFSFQTWVSHFNEGAVPVTKMTAGGRPVGLFPARITRRTAAGVSFRVLSSLRNQHWGTGYPIIGSEPEQAIRALTFGLTRRHDWDVLEIGPMNSGCPLVPLLISAGEEANLAPTVCHREDNWRVRISGAWEEYYKARSTNLRQTVARGERKLTALGQVSLEVSTGDPEISERFSEFCQVEGSGWKGRGGTAIGSDQAAFGFHRDLMLSAAERGTLRLYFVRLNGRAVACVECILYSGVAYGIKMGRDETLAECGLGHVLLKRVLEDLFRTRDIHTFDMMIGGGAHSAYKARWATEKREYVTLRFFNPKTFRGVLARRGFSMQTFVRGLRANRASAHQSETEP